MSHHPSSYTPIPDYHFQISFFFKSTATTEIYTLSLHDALPISAHLSIALAQLDQPLVARVRHIGDDAQDRKSTRLNSSHSQISYAVFCLKKKRPLLLSLVVSGSSWARSSSS